MIEIVTGLRRSGKSYLLFKIFYEKLVADGVPQNHIIRIALDDLEDAFLIQTSERFDIKGHKYIGANKKYYFTDLGLRKALP